MTPLVPVPSPSGHLRMPRHTRIRSLVLLALLAAACTDAPTRPSGEPPVQLPVGRLGVYAQSAALPASGTLVVQVSGPGIVKSDGVTADTLAFNIPLVNGVATGSITVPAGPQRVIMVRAYNGVTETHRGSVTTDIAVGANPTVTITLVPLVGDVTVSVSIGTTIVIVRPAIATLGVGDTLRMSAEVRDQNGGLVTGRVRWATLNPGRASVDTLGLVTMRDTGEVQIVATYGTVGGSAKLSGTPQLSAVAYQLTWNGSVNRNWSEPNNWTPHGIGAARVPVSTDSVVISAGPANQPLLDCSSDQSVRDLVVQAGASLGSSCGYSINVYRRAVGGGAITVRVVARPGATLAGSFAALLIAGDTVSLADSVHAATLEVNGASAGLLLRGHRLQVDGALNVYGGTITLASGDTLSVDGSVYWAGGDETGKLSAGVVLFRGSDFNGNQYKATGTNRLVFARAVAGQQSISGFDYFSNSLRSGLQRWEVRNRDGVRICGYLTVADTISIATTGPSSSIDNATCGGYYVRAGGPVITDANTTVSSYLWELHDTTGTSLIAGGWSPTITSVFATDAALKPSLAYQSVVVNASVRARGNMAIAGYLEVNGAGTTLALNGHRVTVGQYMTMNTGALLVMTNAADTLQVGTYATFNADTRAAELTNITAGLLDVGGYFYGYGFNASGSNLVRLRSSVTGTNYLSGMSFASTDQGFQHLEIAPNAVVGMCAAVRVRGTLTVRASGTLQEYCGGSQLRIDGDIVTEAGSTVNPYSVQLYDAAGTQHVAGAFSPSYTAIYTPLAAGTLKPGLGYTNVSIYAAVSLPADLTVAGDLLVSGTAASLAVNGHRVSITGRLDVNGSATLSMTNAADSVVVNGASNWSGAGAESGKLTAGVLVLRGDSFCAYNFYATGAHKTVFDRTGTPVRVDCGSNTTPFAQVEVRNFGVLLSCTLYATGTVHVLAGARVEQNCGSGNLTVMDTLVTDAGSLIGNGSGYPGGNQLGIVFGDSSGTALVGGTYTPHWSYFTALHSRLKPALGYHSVRIDRSLTFGDSLTFDGDLSLINDGTIVTLGGRRVNVRGSLDIANTAVIQMTNAADTLLVGTGDQNAHMYWQGGDHSTMLTNGVVLFNGSQMYGPKYVATAPNKFVFTGTASGAPISVQGGPVFGRMEIAGTRAVNLADRAVVLDTLRIATATQLSGSNYLQLGPGTGTLVTAPGSDITMPTVYLDGPSGTANVQGRFRPTNTWFRNASPVAGAIKPTLEYNSMHIEGPYQLADSMRIAGDLSVETAIGELQLKGHRLRVTGNTDVYTGGALRMVAAAESLQVAGHVNIGGDAGTSTFSDGVMTVAGDYFYLYPAGSGASGAHKLVLNGTGGGYQDIYTGGNTGQHDIRHLEIASTRTVRFVGYTQVTGNLQVLLPTAVTANVLRVGGNLGTVSGSVLTASGTLELGSSSGTSQVLGGFRSSSLTRFLGAESSIAVRTGSPDSLSYRSIDVVSYSSVNGGPLAISGDLLLSTANSFLTLPNQSAIGNNIDVYGTLTAAGGATGGNYLFVRTGGKATATSAASPIDVTYLQILGGTLDNNVGTATAGFRVKAPASSYFYNAGTLIGPAPSTHP
jgi:hypothetical protein